jgi:16S rRNA (cytidine1402-2'-O)-methyltransferase
LESIASKVSRDYSNDMLYMVATPIGNLKDITFRAVEILKEADKIACEDTRHTKKLLQAYDIQKPLLSVRQQNEAASAKGIVQLLERGETIAYVSDAGTPVLSDPGALLAETVRNAGFQVIPIPGPSGFTALLSVAGLVGKTVTFEGFTSVKPGKRRKRLKELAERGEAFVIYESPFRILKLLADLAEICPIGKIVIGREMTKMHEEYLVGEASELLNQLEDRKSIKGEFSVLVYPNKKA